MDKAKKILSCMKGVDIVCPFCNHKNINYRTWNLGCQINTHRAHNNKEHCEGCDTWFDVIPNIKCNKKNRIIIQAALKR
jgi:hypothetical protein